MRVVGNFNAVSAETKAKIKPLKPGESANYRLLTGAVDIVNGETRFGSQYTIVCRDTIWDEGAQNLVDIGVPKEVKDGEVLRAKKFYIAPTGDNILHNGVFTLQGGNLEHKEFYEFFELCNYNKSNPTRDESIRPIFERIDEVAEAEQDEQALDTLTKALILASKMSLPDLKAFAAGKNWPSREHPAILRSKVKKFARENPDDFLAAQDDPESGVKVLIKQALDAGIISYQPHEHKMVWKDGKTLALLDKPEDGENEVELFTAWLKASKNGDNIQKSISNKLKNG